MQGVALVPVVPPKEEVIHVSTGIRVPKDLLDRLQEIANAEKYTRNEIIVFLLRWGVEAYEKEQKGKRAGH